MQAGGVHPRPAWRGPRGDRRSPGLYPAEIEAAVAALRSVSAPERVHLRVNEVTDAEVALEEGEGVMGGWQDARRGMSG